MADTSARHTTQTNNTGLGAVTLAITVPGPTLSACRRRRRDPGAAPGHHAMKIVWRPGRMMPGWRQPTCMAVVKTASRQSGHEIHVDYAPRGLVLTRCRIVIDAGHREILGCELQ